MAGDFICGHCGSQTPHWNDAQGYVPCPYNQQYFNPHKIFEVAMGKEKFEKWISEMTELDPEVKQILYANLWKLYK